MKKSYIYILPILIAAFFIVSCNKDNDKSENILAKVGDETLTEDDLRMHTPLGISQEDSVKFVRAYINDWINTRLINTIAPEAIGDMSTIDRMVEEYRSRLIANEYKRMTQAALLSQTITEDSLRSYYENHKKDFLLSQPLVKGVYIKADSASVPHKEITKMLSSGKIEDIDLLEKKYADGFVHFDYFRDKWIAWNKIDAVIPFPAGYNINDYVNRTSPTIINNNGFSYFLEVSDYLPEGAIAPFDQARDEVARAIARDNTVDLYDRMIDELFDQGVKNGQVKIFCDLNR